MEVLKNYGNYKKHEAEYSRWKNKIDSERLNHDFELIWEIYPRKEGKAGAFRHYCTWLKGKKYLGKTLKLDNRMMWYATKRYADKIENNETEKQFIQMGSTFFNNTIAEYIDEGDRLDGQSKASETDTNTSTSIDRVTRESS